MYELVAARFGKDVRLEALAIQFKMAPTQVERYAGAIAECLTAVNTQAELIGTDELKERGVID